MERHSLKTGARKLEAEVKLIPKTSGVRQGCSESRSHIFLGVLRSEKNRNIYDKPLIAAERFII